MSGAPIAKIRYLVRDSPDESYGLRVEAVQFGETGALLVTGVEDGLPGFNSGLTPTELVFAINGRLCVFDEPMEALSRISEHPTELRLHVLPTRAFPIPITIKADTKGQLGLVLDSDNNIIVEENSPASEAGLNQFQSLLSLNGELVSEMGDPNAVLAEADEVKLVAAVWLDPASLYSKEELLRLEVEITQAIWEGGGLRNLTRLIQDYQAWIQEHQELDEDAVGKAQEQRDWLLAMLPMLRDIDEETAEERVAQLDIERIRELTTVLHKVMEIGDPPEPLQSQFKRTFGRPEMQMPPENPPPPPTKPSPKKEEGQPDTLSDVLSQLCLQVPQMTAQFPQRLEARLGESRQEFQRCLDNFNDSKTRVEVVRLEAGLALSNALDAFWEQIWEMMQLSQLLIEMTVAMEAKMSEKGSEQDMETWNKQLRNLAVLAEKPKPGDPPIEMMTAKDNMDGNEIGTGEAMSQMSGMLAGVQESLASSYDWPAVSVSLKEILEAYSSWIDNKKVELELSKLEFHEEQLVRLKKLHDKVEMVVNLPKLLQEAQDTIKLPSEVGKMPEAKKASDLSCCVM